MSLVVTLHVFSGRLNPEWVIPDDGEAEFNARLARIADAAKVSNLKPVGAAGGLGYRGFSVRGLNGARAIRIYAGIIDLGGQSATLLAGDRELERWLLGTGARTLTQALQDHVARDLAQRPANGPIILQTPPSLCPQCMAKDAPPFDRKYWGGSTDGNDAVDKNNCYNYANDRITDTKVVPGRASGHAFTQTDTCTGAGSVLEAATSDGLVPCANFTDPLAAGAGWYVALVLWPGHDYHFYRQDKGGCWSHKLHDDVVQTIDNSNNLIRDPQTADRGPYTVFCSYMVTKCCLRIR